MKQPNSAFYTLWSLGILLCVLLSLFSLGFAAILGGSGTPAAVSTAAVETAAPASPAPEQEEDDGTDEIQEETLPLSAVRLRETADAGREYLDKFVFLGDSTTFGIGAYYSQGYEDLCPPSQIWTPANGTLTLAYYSIAAVVYPETGEELPIAEAMARRKPEYMMVTLGINGVAFMDEEWFIRDYTSLVRSLQEASPDSRIILNSIYPIARSYQYQNDINNEKIRAANGWVEQIAADTGVRFLNSYECLVGEDGYLPEEDPNGDGLHLTGEAFTKVMEYIRTHAWQ